MRQWPRLLVLIGLNAIAAGIAAVDPWPMKLLVDYALHHGKGKGGGLPPAIERLMHGVTPSGFIIAAAGATLALFVINSFVSAGLAWTWTVAGRRMVYEVASDLFRRLQRRSLLTHARSNIGDSLTRLTVDTWSVYTVTEMLLIGPVRNVFTLATIGLVAWRLDSRLTLLALTIIPALAASAGFFGRRLLERARKERRAQSVLYSFLQQTLSALPMVKAFTAEQRNVNYFNEIGKVEVERIRRTTLLRGGFVTVRDLITTIGTAVILVAGGRRVIAGTLSLGSLLVFLSYIRNIQGSLAGLLENYAGLKTVEANVERVFDVLDADELVRDAPGALPLPARPKGEGAEVRIENVVFQYERDRPVLRGVTMEARPGEMVAIVGATGAGKTTLVGLVPRFFDPLEGRVTINGIDVRQVQLKSLRDQIALVLQDSFILPLSIADNIAYGRPEATRAEIEEMARAANASEFIERLPMGYDSVVGERGTTLSGGERQRLAIARAFLRDAPILILDEPTSSLDVGTEALVLGALERLMVGRTVLVIAHRLSTVRRANRIVVLEQGQIAEQGTHDELLAAGGLYHGLHMTQFAIRSPEAAA